MDPERWPRVKEVFAQIVEGPAERRAALLHELCADDPEVRREVESLLLAHDGTEHGMQTDAFGIAAQLRTETADYKGRTFGPYRIVREIGRGGMGAVFLAERADGEFQQRVALKIVRRSLADRDLERHFRRERQILATLSHPHIALLLDGGVSADGEPFFVMEYVDGVRIDEYCARTALTTRDRVKLFLKVCRAVAYAHEQRVVHRDLKPSNILVTADGVPKLLDFGIAKLVATGGSGELTTTAIRAFTPDYAAPEQVRGDQQLTAAVDIFSLGVLLGVLVDGSASPRPGRTPPPHVTGDAAHTGDRPPRDPRDTTRRAPLDPELRNIVALAQRAEPERRYPSAREFGQDIERYLDGLPVVAQPDTVAYRVSKAIGRRKRLLTAAALAAGALVTGIAVASFYGTLSDRRAEARPAAVAGGATADAARPANPLANVRTIAVLPLKSLTAAEGPADGGNRADDQALRVGMADAIVTRLSQVPQLAVRPTSATVRYLDEDYDAVEVGRALQVESLLEGTLQRVGNELRTSLQLVDVASGTVMWADSLTSDLANVLRGQESLANRVSRLLALNLSETTTGSTRAAQGSANLAAQDAYLRGNLALTTSFRQVSSILEARDAFEQAIRLDPDFALALAGLSNAYTLAGSLTLLAPQDAYPRAERAARRALEIDPDIAGAYIALAEIEADYNWNWDAAEANNLRAIEFAPNSAAAHQSYAEFLARMGRFGEAATHSDVAQQLDPTRVNYAAVRALHYYYEHRFADAIAQSEQAIDKDPDTYLAYLYLAVSHAAQGDYTSGLEAAGKARALTGGAVSDEFVAGCNYALMNDRVSTERVLQRLAAMSRSQYVDPFLFVAIYAYFGDTARAFEYLERSYTERSYWMTALKVHPVVDSLRADARFDEMLRRMTFE